MGELFIDIHLPGQQLHQSGAEFVDARLQNYGRVDLGHELHKLGAQVSYSRGNESYNLEAAEAEAYPARFTVEDGVTTPYLTPARVELGSINAIRNIMKIIGGGVPELNAPEVRRFALDKMASNELLSGLGVGKAFATWSPEGNIEDALAAIPGAAVILKPRRGMRSKGLLSGSKYEIEQFVRSGRQHDESPGDEWVLEERMDLSLPVALRGRDATEQAKLDRANEAGTPKELRAYVFGNAAGNLAISYVLRAASAGERSLGNDDWVFVDEDSVPEDVWTNTTRAYAELQQATGHTEIHVAFDWFLAQKNGEHEPRWLGMEINGSEPQLVTPKEDQQAGRTQIRLLANQLIRVAQRGGTA